MPKDEVDIHEESWTVSRTGVISEVTEYDDRIRWRIDVWDDNRDPFLTRFFNTKEAAYHFLKRVKSGQPNSERVPSSDPFRN